MYQKLVMKMKIKRFQLNYHNENENIKFYRNNIKPKIFQKS